MKSQQILVHWILITQYLKAIEYLQRPVVQKSFGKYYKFILKRSAVPEEQILSPKKYYRV